MRRRTAARSWCRSDRGAGPRRAAEASSWSISVSTACAIWRAPSACSRSSHPDLPREFPPLRSLDALPGQPARRSSRRSSGARTKSRAIVAMLRRRAAGHADRYGRCGQDAPGDPGGSRGGAALRATVRGSASSPLPTTASPWRSSSPRRWVRQRPGTVAGREHRRVPQGPRARCSCSTTASTFSTTPARWPRRSLAACPGVKVLATSREALEVAGERVVRVALAGCAGSVRDRATARESAAVRLFVDRASDAGAAAAWTDGAVAGGG